MANRNDQTGIYGRWADRDNRDRFHGPEGGHYYGVSYTNVNEPYRRDHVAAVEGLNTQQNRYGFERGFYDVDPWHPQNDVYKDVFFEPVYERRQRAMQQHRQPEHGRQPDYIGYADERNRPARYDEWEPRRGRQRPEQNISIQRSGGHYSPENAPRHPYQQREPWPRQQELRKMNGPYEGTPRNTPPGWWRNEPGYPPRRHFDDRNNQPFRNRPPRQPWDNRSW